MDGRKDVTTMEDLHSIGPRIAALRKARDLTQKQLAQKLDVTDKAVSKWERGAGCPDIALLPPLAAALGVTVGELLTGAPESPPAPPEAVETALHYADQASRLRRVSVSRVFLVLFTVLCALAVGICAICDLALHGRPTWLVYPAASVLFGWLVLAPLLYFPAHRLLMSLASVSLFLLPFLAVLSRATGLGWFFPLGLPLGLAALAWVWVSVLVWQGAGCRVRSGIGAALLLVPFLLVTIGAILWRDTGRWQINVWNLLTCLLCVPLGAWLLRRRPER